MTAVGWLAALLAALVAAASTIALRHGRSTPQESLERMLLLVGQYLLVGRMMEAMVVAKKACLQYPNQSAPFVALARVQQLRGREREAREASRRALEIDQLDAPRL